MCYIWRTSVVPSEAIAAPSDHTISGFRSLLTAFLVLGIIHGLAIVKTMMQYGSAMDRSWESKINKLMMDSTSPTAAAAASSGTDGGPDIVPKPSFRPASKAYGTGRLSAAPGVPAKQTLQSSSPADSGRGSSVTDTLVIPPPSALRSSATPSVIRVQPPAIYYSEGEAVPRANGTVQMTSRKEFMEDKRASYDD